jgi:hypothetical protein
MHGKRRAVFKLRPSADLGLGLGHPSVSQGSPKHDARVTQGSNGASALFATEVKKGRVGDKSLPLINTDDTDQNQKPGLEKTESEVYMPKSIEDHDGFTEEEAELWHTTVKTGEDMRRMFNMRDERRRREWEEEVKEQWPSTKEGQLFTQLAEAFTACQQLVEAEPRIKEMAQVADGERHDFFTMLRDNLEKANRAPRCEYPRSDGRLCRAPKMRGQKYCCMHLAMEAARPTRLNLPALDDANSIQVAINTSMQGLVDGTLDEKRATKLAYFLQLAMSNVGRVKFEPEEEED